jgi:hypothetical protein
MSPEFLKNNAEMLDAAARSTQLRQHLPTTVLIYTHIDTLGWAGSSKQGSSVRKSFEDWVSKWMLPELTIETPTLTATDLYAARCGVLHTLTASSDLSDLGKAKKVAYAWGTATAQALNDVFATSTAAGKVVTLHYETLLGALRNGYERFIASAAHDPVLQQRLEDAAGRHFMIFKVDP